ncbi:MAG TPA: Hsp20/alpha crystallin family protein [Dehalococcoidia bacterium]|nr:Hsp20/alpha crystallin family protein [Dehalococcoidia bacterium]
MQETEQRVPVKVYRSNDRLMVAAPMPGLEPQDIRVTLDAEGRLVLDGSARGAFKGDKEVLQDEWNAGPYRRSLVLDTPVDANDANVTYENGVVVVSLPTSDSFKAGELSLQRIRATAGKRYGNAGHPPGRARLGER